MSGVWVLGKSGSSRTSDSWSRPTRLDVGAETTIIEILGCEGSWCFGILVKVCQVELVFLSCQGAKRLESLECWHEDLATRSSTISQPWPAIFPGQQSGHLPTKLYLDRLQYQTFLVPSFQFCPPLLFLFITVFFFFRGTFLQQDFIASIWSLTDTIRPEKYLPDIASIKDLIIQSFLYGVTIKPTVLHKKHLDSSWIKFSRSEKVNIEQQPHSLPSSPHRNCDRNFHRHAFQ